VVIAVAVPAAAYMANGNVALEFIVLGAVVGFAYRYWGADRLPALKRVKTWAR